jgi:hypothetical protein
VPNKRHAESRGLAFRLNGRREWGDDELVGVRVEDEFEPAHMTPIHDARKRSVLLVLNLIATRRTGPGHGRSGGTQPAGSVAILELSACAAGEKIPSFDRIHAVQNGLSVDERLVALRTEELRSRRLRGSSELGMPPGPHFGSLLLR